MVAVRAQYSDVVQTKSGDVIPAASVEVRQVGVSTKITETIYADATGAGTLANPFTADSAGRFQFYLNKSKRVDLYVSKAGQTPFTLEDVDVVRTGEDPTAIVIASSTASDWQKLGAHYVCDGSGDQADLIAAIAELPA